MRLYKSEMFKGRFFNEKKLSYTGKPLRRTHSYLFINDKYWL